MSLPPGQHLIDEFPRFGAHLGEAPPVVPDQPFIEIRGALTETITVPLSALATLPRTELRADFHCVAGWSVTGLLWEGVAFSAFYREIIAPALKPGAAVTHLVFRGLDRYRSLVIIEDALHKDVLIADRLGGRPLDDDHGAPVRLVSPAQYGYISTKHLCRIEVHTSEPSGVYKAPALRYVLMPHSRARVWKEERHRLLPGPALRIPYRMLVGPIRFLIARGGSRPG